MQRSSNCGWRISMRRRDVLRVRHSKTGTYSELPLLPEPGEAVLRYLEKARPSSAHREVFLRIQAPHRPFKNGSILNCVTSARLRAAGINPQGRKGPHACQSASNFDPRSASNFDPLERRVRAVALAPSELVGVAETARARDGVCPSALLLNLQLSFPVSTISQL